MLERRGAVGEGIRQRHPKRLDIEGMRALAVGAVIAFHFGFTPMSGGFIGVDIFFVISGYLITSLLRNELEASGRINLLSFYGRRARRLLPASLLVASVTLALSYFLRSPPEQEAIARAAAASALYVSNFWFLTQSLDYFSSESALNPFLHTWSLGVEEQFYLVWPAMLLMIARLGDRRMMLGIAAVTVVSFALCLWLTATRQPWAFYSSPARAWEFGLGALCARVSLADRFSPSASSGLGWVGMAMIGVSLFTINEAMAFPGWIAAVPAVGTCLVLMSGFSAAGGGPASILGGPVLQWAGSRSYSLYLWHWPVVVFASDWAIGEVPAVIFSLVVTGAAAELGFRLVEDPLRNSNWLRAKAWRSIGFATAVTCLGFATAFAGLAIAKRAAGQPEQLQIAAAAEERSAAHEAGCIVSFTETAVKRCQFGARGAPRKMVLLGDSHAAQWSTALDLAGKREGWELETYLKSSCPASQVPVYNVRLRRAFDECAAWRDAAFEAILRERPAVVVISQFSRGYGPGPASDMGEHALTADQWQAGLRRTSQRLTEAGLRVIVLASTPTPVTAGNVRDCVARARWSGDADASCDVPRSVAIDDRLVAAEKEAVAAAGAEWVDTADLFCTGETCPATINGQLAYRDDNHITEGQARRLSSALADRLRL